MSETDWHPWFAWFPVNVDAYRVQDIANGKLNYKVCWRWVEYRQRAVMPNGERTEHWQYRLPQPERVM